MTPEGRVKERVKELLRTHGAYWFCPVQTGMGETTLDFLCCHRGRFFAIETKAPGKKMTLRQHTVSNRISEAGGVVFVIDGDEEFLKTFDIWLDRGI